MRKPVLAVLGGSFDPPHIGHVLIPTYLLTRGLAARVLVVPCWAHPFAKRMSPFLDRLTWTRLAMAVHGPAVEVSDIELALAEARPAVTPSYSHEMLTAVAAAFPDYQVRLVIGSDIIADGEVKRWKDYPRIAREFTPIVVPRMGYADPSSCALPEVSSSAVRAWLADPDNPAAHIGLDAAVPSVVLERLRAGIRGHVWLVGHGHVAHHAEAWLHARGWTSTRISAHGLVDGSEELPGMASRPSAPASGPVSRVPQAIWLLCQDPQLTAVATTLAGCGLRPVPVLHASGSRIARDVLAPLVAAGFPVGTLHPICSLRAEVRRSMLDRCSFGIEGDAEARAFAVRLVGEQPWLDLQGLNGASRLRYHAACALVANHLAVLLAEAQTALTAALQATSEPAQGERSPAACTDALALLMRAALENLLTLGIPAGVTGPVARGDSAMAEAHAEALGGPVGALYAELSGRLAVLLRPAAAT